MRWNIYRKMFLFATMMIVLPVALFGFLIYRESEAMMVDRIKRASVLTMENAANHFIKSYIKNIETSLNILAADPLLSELSSEQKATILEKWEQHRQYSENIWSIMYVTTEGDFSIVPHWYPEPDYDSRISVWYQDAAAANGIRWSRPHTDKVTNNTVVTATKVLYQGERLQGVFAIDTSLYKISEIIGSINMGVGGYLVLLDSTGTIIAHHEPALVGTNVQHSEWFHQLSQSNFTSVYIADNNTWVSAVVIPDTGWLLVGFLPEQAFITEVAPMKIAIIVVGLFGIILASFVSALVSRNFVARIHKLVANMAKIEQGDYVIQAGDNSTDEIGELSRKFVVMANKLRNLMEQRDLTETEIRRQKIYFAQLFENSPESIVILDPVNKVVMVNKHFTELFKYEAGEAEGRYIDDLVVPPALKAEGLYVNKAAASKTTVREETVRQCKDGSLVDVEVIGYPIVVDQRMVGTYAIYRDISERKKAERQLEFLTYHDTLTGVYNRNYFDRRIENIAGGESGPYGILVFDVDGLKLVNDGFGHAKGDELLKNAASLIREAAPERAVIARMGGDEFSLLLPQATEALLQSIVAELRCKISEFNAGQTKFAVSLSIGFALAEQASAILEALQEADTRMYKEKLHNSQSTRSAIVRTLMHALNARDFINEGHAERIHSMIEKLARRMGMTNFRIHDLQLFAQFHDLGKVGIPDSVLFKAGPLNQQELDVVQRHSEIGYRIASSSPELNHIADWILKHHEWWNGQGYPIGLSGDRIPAECRILAICDAYDAMISERPYRKAMSAPAALAEIERYRGVMFDPEFAALFITMIKETLTE